VKWSSSTLQSPFDAPWWRRVASQAATSASLPESRQSGIRRALDPFPSAAFHLHRRPCAFSDHRRFQFGKHAGHLRHRPAEHRRPDHRQVNSRKLAFRFPRKAQHSVGNHIAERACVAKGTVYRYFHNKEDLYVALTRHGLNQIFEESRAIIVGPGEADAKLRNFITQIVRFYEQFPYFLELIQRIETSSSPESLNTLNEIRAQYYHAIADLMMQFKQNDRPQLAALLCSHRFARFGSTPRSFNIPTTSSNPAKAAPRSRPCGVHC
jgi:hypothetical protein